ncbi:MAG: tetratricopeptide repeat protein [Beijerinckiaceae bacterium]
MMFSRLNQSIAIRVFAFLVAFQGPAFAQDAAELILRIDRLENLVRQLNGQVEQVQNQNRRLEEQVKRFQNDTDFRFKDLEGGRGGARPTAPGATPPARQQRSDAFNPEVNPQAPGAPQTLGSPGSATAPRATRPAGTAAVATPGQIIAGEDNALGRDPRQPTDLTGTQRGGQPTASIPGTPKGEIDLGKEQLKNGQYEAAEGTFREFTRSRSKDRLVSEAVMGLGDSYFQRQRWREAAEQFVDMTTKYPKSGRAAEAEFKLGISLRGLGANKEACDVLNNHGQKYPNAPVAIKQGVGRELQRARCGG